MRITKNDKRSLARFGCVFLPLENVICIPWRGDPDSARLANISAHFISSQCTQSQLLCLTLEVSRTKALAQYCFVPFDLGDKTHLKYLDRLFESGKIDLRFLTDSEHFTRTHATANHQLGAIRDLYSAALAQSGNFGHDKGAFDRAVSEFERKNRLVDFFRYAFTDSDIRRTIEAIKQKASKATPEEKAYGGKLAERLLELFRTRPEGYVASFLQKTSPFSQALVVATDLQKYFDKDLGSFAQFLTDSIVAHTPKENNQELEVLIPLLALALSLLDRLEEYSKEQASDAQQAVFRGLISKVSSQGWSFETVKRFLSVVGFSGGTPGRPLKDYSNELALWSAGKKWREVAEYNLQNDPDTRGEFGARTFQQLGANERSTLIHRVRIGVTAFATRTGKSMGRNKSLVPPVQGQ